MTTPTKVAFSDALTQLATAEGRRYVEPLTHGTMRLGLYAPEGEDRQTPHVQDELYLIVRGSGVFMRNDERVEFGPGDALFAGAGDRHRFESFSDDFASWVVFWGPPGGEGAARR